MLTTILLILTCTIALAVLIVVLSAGRNKSNYEALIRELQQQIQKFEIDIRNEFRINREENAAIAKENRQELSNTLKEFRTEMSDSLKKTMEITATDNKQMREELAVVFQRFQDSFDKNVHSFNELQREKFSQLGEKQQALIESTEKKLEQMRATVEEKLEKTLSERLRQSFETVGKQLQAVQEGLGEMRILAQDVGGLKKVLSNVKDRGGLGELRLEMLLEQLLAPDQYAANVKTKPNSQDIVEFAIKLPGRDSDMSNVWLPIDAKFPKDAYEQLLDAYDTAEPAAIEAAGKHIENVIKKMARDIRDKYVEPPYTTDFGIMFLPFEGLYAEIIRRSNLMEQLQREFKIVVTGPTTLAAILNSLQMGFRTLALQKRSSEVWTILGAVKSEFEKFGELLSKAQKHIDNAGETIGQLAGTRTRAINRKLKEVQSLQTTESAQVFPEIGTGEIVDEEEL